MNNLMTSSVHGIANILLAQLENIETSPAAGAKTFDWIRAGGLILAIGFSFLLVFYVIYPSLLTRAKKVMPLALYGRCLGAWLFAIQLLILILYWREFVFGDESRQLNAYGPKAAWIVLMLISSLVSVGYFRTPRSVRLSNQSR